MTFSQLLAILDQTHLSPEQLAPPLGIANMTLRRWRKEPKDKIIPKAYERTIIEGIYQLIVDGYLSIESPEVQNAIASCTSLSFQAIIHNFGISTDTLDSQTNHEDKLSIALSQIGMSEKRKKQVDKSEDKIISMKKLGNEWSRRITLLLKAIHTHELTLIDKLVAYGALFYLINPIDLIPDHIPVLGLVDDFGILGFAITYYVSRHPNLFGDQAKVSTPIPQ